ncbi:MAG TPA: DNA translocase FtsK 4TM domain-containing protein [Candidatus Binataceae bacterium]|nr:DNA translocase FtsK 4TM domain-containing protein [Candidatus Binataceae bacterium]
MPAPSPQSRVARELAALALLALAVFGVLSLVSAAAGRNPNLCGILGGAAAAAASGALGLQAYVLALLVAVLAIRVWSGASARTLMRESLGGAVLLVALGAGAGLFAGGGAQSAAGEAGGAIGGALASALGSYLNLGGGYICVMLAVIAALVMMLRRSPTELMAGLASSVRVRRREPRNLALDDGDGDWSSGDADFPIGSTKGEADRAQAGGPPSADARPLKVRRLETVELRGRDARPMRAGRKGGYELPALSLLDMPPAEHAQVDESALERSARVLEQKLADFGVEGRVVEVQPGPVVTMYKFEPGSGIKVSQIVNLADDLSMALRAATVRIQAPVPGEAVVGIEVPNRKREKVYLREIMEAEEFAAARSQLTIALGKDISGRPMAADLATMPHLLIAGATGTGKSVSIHTMIASILFNATADDVRFILIDPKMLELSVYENIPHLLVPVVVDPEKAAAALLWATQEMETRYRMMREMGVRNIDGYNRALGAAGKVVELKPVNQVEEGAGRARSSEDGEPIKHRRLPKIVIVIDELADLLLSEGKTVERDITRLAQKARASGIHLILATQRPSVDVLTGLIKANLPARISLQVTSRVDSRTILDSIGAERLLGAGDMLFMPPGSAKLRRLHGPFVSETEIRRVVDFLRAQGAPDYQMEILETKVASEDGLEGGGFEADDLYDEAVRIVLETNQASVSMIQRRLRIGYNRAARMVEQMEREGLVTPGDGMRPREVRSRNVN